MSSSTDPTRRRATVTQPSDREVRAERIFDASLERVWRAFTDPREIAQWWGRGHEVDVERMEVERGGHWRFVEHTPEGMAHGFEGRYGDVVPMERIAQTFDWDGMPGHPSVTTTTFDDLGDGRTRVVTTSIFYTTQERDGMVRAGMERGMNESYAALDEVLGDRA